MSDEAPIFETEEELKDALNWLSLHGYIEVTGVNDEGEFFYGTTEKGRNATAEELTQIMEDEEQW